MHNRSRRRRILCKFMSSRKGSSNIRALSPAGSIAEQSASEHGSVYEYDYDAPIARVKSKRGFAASREAVDPDRQSEHSYNGDTVSW